MRIFIQLGFAAAAAIALARPSSYRARRSVDAQVISGGTWRTLAKDGVLSFGSIDNGPYYLSRRAVDPVPPSKEKALGDTTEGEGLQVRTTDAQKQKWDTLQNSLNEADDEVKTRHATAVEYEGRIRKLLEGLGNWEMSKDDVSSLSWNLRMRRGREGMRVRNDIDLAERNRGDLVSQVQAFRGTLPKGSDLHTQVGLATSQHPVPENKMSKMGKEVIEALAKEVKG